MASISNIPILTHSWLKGAGALVANTFVKLASGKLEPLAAATDIPVGVCLETTTKTDLMVPVGQLGIFSVIVGTGGVTQSTTVKIDASGQVVAATPANGEVIVGVALETVAAAGIAKILVGNAVRLPST